MKRFHIITDKGRKITWKESREAAIQSAEKAGFKVIECYEQPDPLKDAAPPRRGEIDED